MREIKVKLIQGIFFQGMLVGRKRENGYRELYLPTVIMKNGRPANVMLIKEDAQGYIIPGTMRIDAPENDEQVREKGGEILEELESCYRGAGYEK